MKDTEDIIKSLCDDIVLQNNKILSFLIGKPKSPIEIVLSLALYKELITNKSLGVYCHRVFPQHEVKLDNHQYIADILLQVIYSKTGKLIDIYIECDGHDYHERTKEQAAHDRQRDRLFTSHNLKLFRFTGSEIYHDYQKCVDEIIYYILKESVNGESAN